MTVMGVTIHFEGQLTGEEAYVDLIALVSSIAKAEAWKIDPIENSEVTLLRVRSEENWDYVGPVKGITVYLHDDCDPVRFEFDKDLYVQEFTKTQFAGVDVHLKVMELLRATEPFFKELKVEDEAEFWETTDVEILKCHFDRVQNVIEDELKKNPRARFKVKDPRGRIIDLIT